MSNSHKFIPRLTIKNCPTGCCCCFRIVCLGSRTPSNSSSRNCKIDYFIPCRIVTYVNVMCIVRSIIYCPSSLILSTSTRSRIITISCLRSRSYISTTYCKNLCCYLRSIVIDCHCFFDIRVVS